MEPVEVSTIRFAGTDGVEIEGDLLHTPRSSGFAVVCHPHPLYGGNRHDGVVATISRALVEAGRQVLRFDFRGAGGSTGSHSGGPGELDDLRAAVSTLQVADGEVIIAGYSFGADVALNSCFSQARGWLAVAPPLSVFAEFAAADDPRPKHLIAGAHDQFRPAGDLAHLVGDWKATSVSTIASADHFFHGAHSHLSAATLAFARGRPDPD